MEINISTIPPKNMSPLKSQRHTLIIKADTIGGTHQLLHRAGIDFFFISFIYLQVAKTERYVVSPLKWRH